MLQKGLVEEGVHISGALVVNLIPVSGFPPPQLIMLTRLCDCGFYSCVPAEF